MEPKLIKVNVDPIHKFTFSQIPNHDFNFALLNGRNRFLHNWVTCKDYFQDIFWAEYSGKEGSQYGLKWKKGMLNTRAKKFKLAVHGGAINMEEKVSSLQQFINIFDKAQGFTPTEIKKTDDNKLIVVIFSKEWTASAPLLSTLTTLIRLGGKYQGEDVKNYIKNIKAGKDLYMQVEIDRLKHTYNKLLAVLEGKKVEFPWKNILTMYNAHSLGIVGWKEFPTVKET